MIECSFGVGHGVLHTMKYRHFSVKYKQFAVGGRFWLYCATEIGLFICVEFAIRLMWFSLFPFHCLTCAWIHSSLSPQRRSKSTYFRHGIFLFCFIPGRRICYLSHWTPRIALNFSPKTKLIRRKMKSLPERISLLKCCLQHSIHSGLDHLILFRFVFYRLVLCSCKHIQHSTVECNILRTKHVRDKYVSRKKKIIAVCVLNVTMTK